MSAYEDIGTRIAIVGMSARLPGAPSVEHFWRNLREGAESVRFFSREELLASGLTPAEVSHPDYVPAAALLDDVDGFDAAYFGYSPREAEQIDPQQRVLLEVAAAALEDAGHARPHPRRRVGVFVGASMSHYAFNLYSQGGLTDPMGSLRAFFGNAESHLATRISYKLDLTGPSLFVQTACSTSLVAIHLACQSLLSHECDVALAGGSSITVPRPAGYLSREGGVLSPDGHCRGFDAEARGTIIGNGAGAVVLRRLEDALADGDTIHAVVLGSAINNDGSGKVGYTAPSQEGQAAVVAEALAVAGVDPDTISYVEAHGTGTQIGDPIEVAALTQAYRAGTARRGYCAIGSVKSNFGHLLAAAGVAGVIKTVQALRHREIPPHLHFRSPNPRIDFASSPFFVADRLRPWESDGTPRRAGVSSFGIGGTNAHLVLEEAPAPRPAGPARRWQLLPVSARTDTALHAAAGRLSEHLEGCPDPELPDVAYTLQVGRREHARRRVVVCRTAAEGAELLAGRDPARVAEGEVPTHGAHAVFLFPGQGAQTAAMGAELYREEPVFRRWLDRCARVLAGEVGVHLGELLQEPGGGGEALVQTRLAQPALFAVEFALARWWMHHGVRPRAMAGHSIGEYVAACLAGVFTLEDALRVVALRGRLMQECEPGAMLALPLAEADARALLPAGVALAAVNGEKSCVASGPFEAVEALERELAGRGLRGVRLRVSHAFHSATMEPAAAALAAALRGIRLSAPRIPFLSNVTGTWIIPEEAVRPEYWARQLRETVRFGDCLRTLAEERGAVLVEVGPGRTLSALAARVRRTPPPVASLPEAGAGREEQRQLFEALGRAWVQGAEVAWHRLHRQGERRRVPLPTYPFEHQRYWVEERRDGGAARPQEHAGEATRSDDVGEWFYVPSWRRTLPLRAGAGSPEVWLVFADRGGVADGIREHLLAGGERVVLVEAAADDAGKPVWPASDRAALRPGHSGDYDTLLARLGEAGWRPRRILHLWSLDDGESGQVAYDSLLRLAQALGRQGWSEPLALGVVTGGVHRLAGEPRLRPGGAPAAALCRVIPQEFPTVACRHVDIVPEAWSSADAEALLAEMRSAGGRPAAPGALEERVVALRGGGRWVQQYEPQPLPAAAPEALLRPGGVYLITGGLGGMGLQFAGALARVAGARLILTGRSPLPPREEWEGWLLEHGEDHPAAQRIRVLRQIEDAGAELMVVQADVADRAAMAEVVSHVRERFGGIDGVIHAAGVPGGAMIQRQTTEGAARVLAPKVEGAQVLDELLRDNPPDFMVLCSSLASVRGGFGQGDYCAANAYLDAFAWARDGRRTRVVSLNWGAWAEVGMAVDAVRRRGFLPCPFWLKRAEGAEEADGHPFLGRCIRRSGGERAVRSELRVGEQWVLAEHTVGGRPTWPGTAYLELVRAAWSALGGDTPVELRDVSFLSPLTVGPSESRSVFTLVEGEGAEAAFRVASAPGGGDEDPEQLQEHARGRLASIPPAERRIDVGALLGRCLPVALDGGAQPEGLVGLGPRWHCLESLHTAAGEGVAVLALPSGCEGDLERIHLHPALLDVALGVAKRVAGVEGDHLPLSYGRVRLYAPLPERVVCHVVCRTGVAAEGRVQRFDATLADSTGRVLVEVEDYALRRIDDVSAQLGALAVDRGSAEADALIAGAIRSHEGVDALFRALASGATQLVVSPLPLDAVLRKWSFEDGSVAERIGGVRLPQRAAERPEGAGEYTPPEGEVEERVAGLWSELLGIARIGRTDDFFHLGGDSLLGIQLHSRLKESFRIDVPLATVFEHPTVAGLAAVVENELLGSLGEEELLRHIRDVEGILEEGVPGPVRE